MKILITGCAGFIGFHIARKLICEGHEVVGVDNLNDYYSPALKKARLNELGIDPGGAESGTPVKADRGAFTFICADVADYELYARHLDGQGFDLVCHLAAQAGVRYSITNPHQYIVSNITGFWNMLEYCRHNPVRRFVYASSSSVYGANTSIPYRENDSTDSPLSLYAATKKADEVMAYSYSALYGLNSIGLRFFTVYGPWGRPDMAPFIFTKAVMEDQPIEVFNNGDMSRDYTYVDDITEGVCRVLLAEPEVPSETNFRIYNIGNSSPVALGDFISALEKITGKTAVKILRPMQPGDVKLTWADTSLLRRDYGYSPSTPLESGLSEFVNWYRTYYGK